MQERDLCQRVWEERKRGKTWYRTSPVFHAEKITEAVRHKRRDALEVVSAYASGQEGLVGVSERGVHEQQTPVGTHRLRETIWTLSQQHIPETYWRLTCTNTRSQLIIQTLSQIPH